MSDSISSIEIVPGVSIDTVTNDLNSVKNFLTSIGIGDIPAHITNYTGPDLTTPQAKAILALPEVQSWINSNTAIITQNIVSQLHLFPSLIGLQTQVTSLAVEKALQGKAVQAFIDFANTQVVNSTVTQIQSTVLNVAQPNPNSGAQMMIQYPNAATTAQIQQWIDANPGATDLPPGLKYVNYLGVNANPEYSGGTPILNPNIPASFKIGDSSFIELIKALVFVPFMPIAKLKG